MGLKSPGKMSLVRYSFFSKTCHRRAVVDNFMGTPGVADGQEAIPERGRTYHHPRGHCAVCKHWCWDSKNPKNKQTTTTGHLNKERNAHSRHFCNHVRTGWQSNKQNGGVNIINGSNNLVDGYEWMPVLGSHYACRELELSSLRKHGEINT